MNLNKIVAIFGLDARIKKFCCAEFVCVRTNFISVSGIFCKRGAMFGLDARIALAIFGALSVITSAVLYSAIQEAKAIALLTDMQEIGKAWEAYYLDTRKPLPGYPVPQSTTKIQNLVENIESRKGWRGPYLPYEVSAEQKLKYPKIKNANIYLLKITNLEVWGGSNVWTAGVCSTGRPCFIWSHIQGVKKAYSEIIDSKIDGSNGPDKGIYRWNTSNAANPTSNAYLQISSIDNPND